MRSERRGSLLLLKWTRLEEEEEEEEEGDVEGLGRETRGRDARAGVVAGWTDIGSMVYFRIREEEDEDRKSVV